MADGLSGQCLGVLQRVVKFIRSTEELKMGLFPWNLGGVLGRIVFRVYVVNALETGIRLIGHDFRPLELQVVRWFAIGSDQTWELGISWTDIDATTWNATNRTMKVPTCSSNPNLSPQSRRTSSMFKAGGNNRTNSVSSLPYHNNL